MNTDQAAAATDHKRRLALAAKALAEVRGKEGAEEDKLLAYWTAYCDSLGVRWQEAMDAHFGLQTTFTAAEFDAAKDFWIEKGFLEPC